LLVKKAWPFINPVKREEVPDYYDIVKKPMDLQTIREGIDKNRYHSKENFEDDIKLVFSNAKSYNHKNTIYYKYAVEVESYADKLLSNLKYDYDDRNIDEENNTPGVNKKIKTK
jgi:hypothetical protein